jgi:acyl carrier protein
METIEIKSKIKEIIGAMFDVNASEISDAKPFREMAKYDSMRALELLAKLENEFDIMIDPDQLPNMYTVERVVKVIENHLHAK